eukprot:5362759-Lingulodinium_polyedra.AAC.1
MAIARGTGGWRRLVPPVQTPQCTRPSPRMHRAPGCTSWSPGWPLEPEYQRRPPGLRVGRSRRRASARM